jgi:hypothetical protein
MKQLKELGVIGDVFLEDKEQCSTRSVKTWQQRNDVMSTKVHLKYKDSPGFESGGKRKFL